MYRRLGALIIMVMARLQPMLMLHCIALLYRDLSVCYVFFYPRVVDILPLKDCFYIQDSSIVAPSYFTMFSPFCQQRCVMFRV